MYSLRTDDIPGARPRLRHYEKKLIREHEKEAPERYIPSFPTLEEIKLQIQERTSQQRDSNPISVTNQAMAPASKAKLVLPEPEVEAFKGVQLSESQIAQLEQLQPRYRKSSLQLPANQQNSVQNPQEARVEQVAKPQKPQSPIENRSMLSSRNPPSRQHPLIEGTTFNIITNHRVQYKIEPLGYVPSWS